MQKVSSAGVVPAFVVRPSISTGSLPSGEVSLAYSVVLAAFGGRPPYSWSASGLPSNLNCSSAGVITGIPAVSGNFSVTLNLSDANLTPANPVTLGLFIQTQPLITTASLPSGGVAQPYSFQMTATGGTPGYTWSAVGLPAGLSISPSGLISGTPSASGSATPSFTATDTLGVPSAPTGLNLTIGANPPQQLFSGYYQANAASVFIWPTPVDTGSNGYTYNVYRNGVKVTPAGGITPTPSSLSRVAQLWYVDLGLTPSTTYSYTASATAGGVETSQTAAVSVTTLSNALGTTLPTAPTSPSSWLPTLAGLVIPTTGTLWTATVTSDTTVTGTAGTGSHNAIGCSFQYALANAALGDVIVLTAGAVYSTTVAGGFQVGTPAGSGTLYVISTQVPEYAPQSSGTLPACSVTQGLYVAQNLTLTAAVPYGALSATLTAPWTGRTGWFPMTFTPTQVTDGTALSLTAVPNTGDVGGTLTANWTGPTGYMDIAFTSGGSKFRKALFSVNSPAITWGPAVRAGPPPDITTATFTLSANIPETHLVYFQANSTAISWTSAILQDSTAAAYVVPGNYVTPGDAGQGAGSANSMAIISYGTSASAAALNCLSAAANTRFIGLWFRPIPSVQSHDITDTILLPTQATAGSAPVTNATNITLERCLWGNDSANYTNPTGGGTFSLVRHGVYGHGDFITLHQCFFWDLVGTNSADSYAFNVFVGGPQCVQNCYFACGSESCEIGGVYVPNVTLAHDGVWRWNYSVKPDQWRINHLGDYVKNHWENKIGNRFEVYQNWAVNCWYGSFGQQNGRGAIALARDNNAEQNLPITSANLLSPYINVTSTNYHDNIFYNHGQGLETGTSDFSENPYSATIRFANNIVHISPGVGGTTESPPSNGWGVEWLGPVPNVTIDHCTFIIHRPMLANADSESVMLVNGAWCSPSATGFQSFTPNLQEAISIRTTITNNVFDGSRGIFASSFSSNTYLTGIDPATFTFGSNAFIFDPHAYGGTNSNVVGGYAGLGCAVTPVNYAPPANPANWQITSGTLAGASTTGGPIGALFGTQPLTALWPDPLPSGTVGTPYSYTLTATGGTPPYSFGVASGTLPAGLTLNSSTGLISGIPSASANFDAVTFSVTDSGAVVPQIRQHAIFQHGQPGTANSPWSATFSQNVLPGSMIYVVAMWPNFGSTYPTMAVWDSLNGGSISSPNFTRIARFDDRVTTNLGIQGTQSIGHWYFLNSAGGADTISYGPSTQTTEDWLGMVAFEITGATASPIDGNNITNQQPTPGTSNALVVSASNAHLPALMIALTFNESGATATTTPSAGTGYVTYLNSWDIVTATFYTLTVEIATLTAIGSNTATFTPNEPTGAGTNPRYLSVMAIFN